MGEAGEGERRPTGPDERRLALDEAREAMAGAVEAMVAHAERLEQALPDAELLVERAAARSLELLEARLDQTASVVASSVEARLREELAAARRTTEAATEAAVRVAAAAERLSRRTGRREARLTRAETSRRIETALERLETRSHELTGELEQVAARLNNAAAARIDSALSSIAESERRILEGAGWVETAERRSYAAMEAMARADELLDRLRAASTIEEEAARRIFDAERRLMHSLRLDPLGE